MKVNLTSVKHFISFLSIFIISAQSFGQIFFMPESITYKKLDNGFSYYILPDDGERGKVTVHLVSTVGSLVERLDERGVAHFVEHMVFKGSKNYPGEETMLTLDKMGLRIGRDYNASVNSTKTEYHINLPEDNWSYLQQTLLLMKDWVGDLQMEDTSFKVEQKVVIEEIKKRNSSVSPYLNGTILEGHGGLGTESQINGITAKQVKDFYDKYYTPDQFALVIQGKVNEKKVAKFIDKIFRTIPINHNTLERSYIDVTKETTIDSNYISSIRNSKPTLVMAFKTPSYAIDSHETFKNNFKQYLFCKILENRLATYPNKSISETSINKGEILPGSMMYNIRLQGRNTTSYSAMLDNFCKAVAEARTHGFTQEEIDFFMKEFISKTKRGPKANKVTLNEVVNHFLNGDIPLNNDQQYELLIGLHKSLRPSDFTEILNTFTAYHKTILFDSTSDLYSSDFTKAYILNKLEHINTEFTVLPKYQFVEPNSNFVVKNKSNLPDISLETQMPIAIEKKTTLGTDLYLLEYKNGISVVVNNAPTAKPKIRIVSKHGLNDLPMEDQPIFNVSLDLFGKSFGENSEKEASSFLRQYMFSSRTEISKDNFEFELRSANQSLNFENLLKAFYLVVANENSPDTQEVLEKLRFNKQLDSLNNIVFNKALVERMFAYNQLFKRSFKDSYLYIGGDLPENIDTLISTYIATVPVLEWTEKIPKTSNTGKVVAAEYVEDRKVKTQSRASFIFKKQFNKDYTFKYALIAEAIAEHGYHQIFEILRKKYGLIYTLGVTGSGNKPAKTSLVSLRYISDNDNLQRSKAVMINEILIPMNQGNISNESIEIAKAKLATKLDLYFYDDEVISDIYLKRALEYGKLFTIKDLNKAIKNISDQELRNHMTEIIQVKNL
ncbi:insulinase family protein [Mangrovimonas xylaniphaga]|uniref:insulinase family protein n=1 Tax=Mangrovimonas xylaniphaga TaxID=1645915 RepID=UPI0006B4846A|nr:insulinase family protein [Mangrovimonas xylaniphaga]